MKLLSIDIGIKNLAFIIIDCDNNEDFTILAWDIINLCNNTPNCCINNCKKSVKFYKTNNFYCKDHAANLDYKIPNINKNKIHKLNIKELKTLANSYDISFNKNILKKTLFDNIYQHLDDNCLNHYETVNANSINLIELGINLKNQFDEIFKNYEIDYVILENQIGPLAVRMKSIQGMIAQYFINLGIYNIEFISSINKLNFFIKDKKTSYTERKKISCNLTKQYIEKNNIEKYRDFFYKHKKQDDLADCFLQAMFFLDIQAKI